MYTIAIMLIISLYMCHACYNVYVIDISLCSMSMKVPAIIDEVNRACSEGMAVVIGLQTTGEVQTYTSIYCKFRF